MNAYRQSNPRKEANKEALKELGIWTLSLAVGIIGTGTLLVIANLFI